METDSRNSISPGTFRPHSLPLNHLDLPAAGTVHLWYLDLLQLGSPLAQGGGDALASLSPRQERTIRRFYLRLLLGAYLRLPGKEVVVSRMMRGKPVLDSNTHRQTMDFSIAGSAGCCLIGICSEGLIGVDLELVGRRTGNPQGLARRYFNASEARALAAYGSEGLDRAFLHTWACKEAVVKAAGHGIANQLCRFSVSTDPESDPDMLEMRDDDPAAWRLAVVRPTQRHLGAVALRHGEMSIETFNLVHRD